MSEETAKIDQTPTRSETATLKRYRWRMVLAGLAIVAIFVLVGIGVSFYEWDHGSPFDLSTWEDAFVNPIARATYGPFLFALFVFPITVPIFLILVTPIYFGLKKPKRWPLAAFGFALMGVLWVFWITGVWQMD